MPSVSEPSSNVEVKALLSEMNALDLSKQDDRRQMSLHAQGIVNAFQNPVAKAFELMFSCTILPCARIAVDLNMFPLIAAEPMNAKELAEVTRAEELLIVRIARPLVAAGIIKQDEDGRYEASSVSNVFCLPSLADGLKHCFDLIYAPCAHLPSQLRDTDFKNPNDPHKTSYQLALNTDKHFFNSLADAEPEPARLSNQFNNFMTAFRSAKPPWTTLFPIEDVVYKDAKEDTAMLVDVGGGSGHDLVLFKQAIPEARGVLYLQDLAGVIGSTSDATIAENREEAGYEIMEHDFFAPQPVKGARAYLLKSVLHDWPDSHALKILENITSAMKSGYSKLLIVENIFPEDSRELPLATTGLDITMMVQFASLERTEKMWRKLIDAAGLRVENIWKGKDGDSVIMCER
ncbi:MAG: hypothetical protein M1828_001144 [Chrysothrix sp. TS-e1954]|nr:MAG: hypothetical protein M1828_001144 [Chrysothrix sp. TS-e1954]